MALTWPTTPLALVEMPVMALPVDWPLMALPLLLLETFHANSALELGADVRAYTPKLFFELPMMP